MLMDKYTYVCEERGKREKREKDRQRERAATAQNHSSVVRRCVLEEQKKRRIDAARSKRETE